MEPSDVLGDGEVTTAVLDRVHHILAQSGAYQVTTSKSQVAFRARRGFAYLWRPDRYLRGRTAELVLSIALNRHDLSDRFKEVAHPSTNIWMHHLEIGDPADIDDQVAAWLLEARDEAG
jgi:hypothetical protein